MESKELIKQIESGVFDSALATVYVTSEAVEEQKKRYAAAIKGFEAIFDTGRNIMICSAPGRTEVCGNHTDHNNGRVLAAAINLDAIAIVALRDDRKINVKSKGFEMDSIDLSALDPVKKEHGRSVALLRGVCSRFEQLGFATGGFDAYTTSQVFSGSGLSSSAAYEVLLGTVLNHAFNGGKVNAVQIAQIAQYAENVFFDKPCGLMDQMASSVGSFVTIDFNDAKNPVIEKIDFDFSACNHSLCIVDTGGSHSDLTGDYAAVRSEMESVAAEFGKQVLAQVDFKEFMQAIPQLRKKLGDRAVMRAIHFFNENKRVKAAVAALDSNNFEVFKQTLIQSGFSSFMYNQNVFTPRDINCQGVSLALAISEEVLCGKGAYRVHGGGFAGTIQAFVPNDILDEYIQLIENTMGKGSCYVLSIRPVGGVRVI